MSDAPWQPPDATQLIARIQATDAGTLAASATALERAAKDCEQLTSRIRGIRAGVPDNWPHGGIEAFLHYSRQVIDQLCDGSNALHTVARELRIHAEATEEAKRGVVAADGLANAQKYIPHPDPDAVGRMNAAAVERFHTSEQTVRAALWKFGEVAPVRIPLPGVVPLPEQPGWLEALDPSLIGNQYWLDGHLHQHPAGDIYDESHKLYGYDEDGRFVPAFMADPMRSESDEDGFPIKGILEFLPIGSRVFKTADEAARVMKTEIAASSGFRAGHIDKHVREFFYRGKKPLASLTDAQRPPVTVAQRQEFLDIVTRATLRSDRVYPYSAGDTTTNAILYFDTDKKRWLLIQFRRQDGAFSTAFEPNPKKLDNLLKERGK